LSKYLRGAWGAQVLALTVCATLSGCTPRTPPEKVSSPVQVWGTRGTRGGEFFEPRALTIAPNGFAWIVDSSGRIQKWSVDGKFDRAWTAPSTQKGRPEGVAVHPNGNIYVTDTHYSRVLIYTPDGKLLKTFGRYGRMRGGFLLVTGIAIDSDGFVYLCDYGGDFDRVSKWTGDGKIVASWPGHGEGPRQFRRPCGLAFSKEGDLLVADIANHRVQRLDKKTGVCKSASTLGPRGGEPGQLTYPYGVAVDREGFIYTVEYGAHRVQKWSAAGKYLASWGKAGRAVGELANPWGLALDAKGNVYVADTQNHRVQKFRFSDAVD
jgi:DNA-binding beta-propeller fold protein YncE